MNLDRRSPTAESSWVAAALCLVLLLPGLGMVWGAVREGTASIGALSVQGWAGIIGIPFALGLLVPVAFAAVETSRERRVVAWRAVRSLIVIGLLAGILALAGGHLFTEPGRNGLLLGFLLIGGASGVAIAQLWRSDVR